MTKRTCTNCEQEKEEKDFYTRPDGRLHWWCKKCFNKRSGAHVTKRRRNIKLILVEEHGSICSDCNTEYPPFVLDFDHREPAEKSFTISASTVLGIDRLRTEAEKCDLVCSNCHRIRTHKRQCSGCLYCEGDWRSRLACFPDKEKVIGSNPISPTWRLLWQK